MYVLQTSPRGNPLPTPHPSAPSAPQSLRLWCSTVATQYDIPDPPPGAGACVVCLGDGRPSMSA